MRGRRRIGQAARWLAQGSALGASLVVGACGAVTRDPDGSGGGPGASLDPVTQEVRVWQAAGEPLPTSLVIVLDASASMEASFGSAATTKWEATRDALGEFIRGLDARVAVGLVAFPNRVVNVTSGAPGECVNLDAIVPPAAPAQGTSNEVVLAALQAVTLETCTPTPDAYALAVHALGGTPTPARRHALLITDGPPTLPAGCGVSAGGQCATDGNVAATAQVVDAARSARLQLGIRTFGAWLPHDQYEPAITALLFDPTWLSEIALAGGTAPMSCDAYAEPYCHFDLDGAGDDFPGALAAALAVVAAAVAPCRYAVPAMTGGDAVALPSVALRAADGGHSVLEPADSPACLDGWYVDAAEAGDAGPVIGLCHATCVTLQRSESLTVEFGAPAAAPD